MNDDAAKQLKVLWVVRIAALRLVAIIRSVTLFLKSLNDYKITYLSATYFCIQGWSHSMFLLRKILFLTQTAGNQLYIEIEWTARTVILSDDWTIFERFWILAIAFGQERERKYSIYLFKKEEYTVYVYFLEEEMFHQKLCGLVISQTFTSWNTAVPFSLNTFHLPQTLQFKSLVTWKRD